MDSEYRFFWTDEAIQNLESILEYLNIKWTKREADHFKFILNKQIELIQKSPLIFPISEYNQHLRKAVLSKQTTIFYKVSGSDIYIVYLFVSRQDIFKII